MNAQTVKNEGRFTWLGRQIPNILTVIRIILVPVFIYLFIVANGDNILSKIGQYYYQMGALVVFCVAAYTDYLDGLLARRWNLVTNFGKLVDPIADKALMMSSFILLSYYSWLFWWFTVLVILREFAVTFMRFILLRGGKVLPASQGGKLKTLLQCLLVFLLLLQPLIEYYIFLLTYYIWAEILVLIGAFVATLVSGFVYFLDSWKDLRDITCGAFRTKKSRVSAENMTELAGQKTVLPANNILDSDRSLGVEKESVLKPDAKSDSQAGSFEDSTENNAPIESQTKVGDMVEDNCGLETLVYPDSIEEYEDEDIIFSTPFWKPLRAEPSGNIDKNTDLPGVVGVEETGKPIVGVENRLEDFRFSSEITTTELQSETTMSETPADLPVVVANSEPRIKYPPRRNRNRN